ncbi:MarR family winged helix-turn-helix transcriptional regulator [Acidimangrovimonas pyrenivorans]|uniref:MarR family winged helix-turn-helix transcriptional regulator n=1 Tax=Acidimangrovimonas pyrenivorans TaxID=2030798 RepID=A0ABV7AEY4_9RHOB
MRKRRNIPDVGEGKRGEDGHLGYLLRQAAQVYRNRADRALSDLGITPPQFSVLTMLAAYPGRSGADIARLAMLTPQTVSVIIGNLEKRGAILRRPHPVHGRIQTIELTGEGRALLTAARARMQRLEEELTANVSAGDEAAVRRWLVGVAVVAGADDDGEDPPRA